MWQHDENENSGFKSPSIFENHEYFVLVTHAEYLYDIIHFVVFFPSIVLTS